MAFLTICLFFVAALAAHSPELLNNKVQAHLMAMRPTASLNVKVLQDMATDCATAFHALEDFTQNSSCATSLGLLWDNTTSSDVSDGIIDAYCTPDSMNKSCADKLADLMTAALTQCQAVWASNFTAVKEEVRKFLYVAKVPCVRVNNRLCFKDFKRIANVTSDKFTRVGLDSICTQCTAVIFGLMAQFAPVEFLKIGAFLETTCHQINGEYCILKFQAFIDDQENSPPGGEPTAPQLDMICSPCVQTVLFRLAHLSALNNDTDSVANLTRGLAFSAMVCQKNFAGQYCFVQLTKYFNSTDNHLDDCNATIATPTSRATCPGSSCQRAIQNFRSSQGCCLGTWFNMLEMQYEFGEEEDGKPTPKEMRDFAEDSCKVNIPVGCAQAKLIIAFVIAGIDPVWAAQNKQALENAVKLALAYKLAIDVAAITLSATGTSTQSNGHHLLATNGGISFSATVETSTDTQTSRGLTNSASNLDLSVLSSQLPAAALSDPINGVQTQSAQITTVNNDGNGASLHSPATWIISLMALAALAIRA